MYCLGAQGAECFVHLVGPLRFDRVDSLLSKLPANGRGFSGLAEADGHQGPKPW